MEELIWPPPDEELELYKQLEKTGVECGVHDPVWPEPIEATLHLERFLSGTLHFEHSLRLECNDPSLDLTKSVSRIQTAMRDGVGGGHGVALLDASAGVDTELRILVFQAITSRNCMCDVLRRLKEDSNAYREAPLLFGCIRIPTGCSCLKSRRRKPQAATPAPTSPTSRPTSEEGHDFPLMPMASTSSLDSSFPEEARSPSSGRRRGKRHSWWPRGKHHHAPTHCLNDVKLEAQRLWQTFCMRQSTSFGRKSSIRSRLTRRKSFGEMSDVTRSDASAGDVTVAATSTTGPNDNRLDAVSCVRLLMQLLGCGGEDDEPPIGGPSLFAGVGSSEDRRLEFEDFWSVCHIMLLTEIISEEPTLKKSFTQSKDGPVLSLKDWQWFLVAWTGDEDPRSQVGSGTRAKERNTQARDTVEAARAQFAELQPPEKDESGQLTLYGMSRLLCSESNSLFDPNRLEIYQDMSRPLAEYWISTAHHLYADIKEPLAPPPAADAAEMREPSPSPRVDEPQNALGSISAALQSGCRCLSFALVAGSSGRGGDQRLHVLLRQQRMPFDEVLRLIRDEGFRKEPAFPLLLVLSMALLSPAHAADVPNELQDGLGDRLWRNTSAELPSPQDACGHAIVVLAPMAGSDPMTSDLALRLMPPASLAKWPKDQVRLSPSAAGAADTDPLEAWQKAAKVFAVWPGCTFDRSFPQRSPLEISIGFLPADELQALEEAKTRQLIEYHRQYITMSYPVASRCMPTNSNPASAWSVGIQMAAVIFNGSGNSASLAHAGRFAQDNGACGYVLKPPHLRICTDPDEADEGQTELAENAELVTLTLKLRVLAARAVVPSSAHHQVSLAVSIWGATSDCKRETFRPVQAHGGHVVEWPEARSKEMTFVVKSPSTAVLVFELSELALDSGRSQSIGGFAAPLSGVRQGIRWVRLWKSGSMEASATAYGSLCGLLVHSTLTREKRKPTRRSMDDRTER